jgi:hypothetical protein
LSARLVEPALLTGHGRKGRRRPRPCPVIGPGRDLLAEPGQLAARLREAASALVEDREVALDVHHVGEPAVAVVELLRTGS